MARRKRSGDGTGETDAFVDDAATRVTTSDEAGAGGLGGHHGTGCKG